MTSPSVSVDIAAEAGASFSLEGKNLYTWQVEDSGHPIRALQVNQTESLLLASSNQGISIWGLSCNPIRNLVRFFDD